MAETPLKILVVDDKPENLIIMERLLRHLDVRVLKAQSGPEALSLVLRHEFALIVLDVNMPGMDGFEVAEALRDNYPTMHIPIVFVTDISKEERHIFKGYELGAVDYIVKPINPEILPGKIKVFLDLAKNQRELKEALEELKRVNHQNRLLLECAGEGILGLDEGGNITFLNPAAESILKTRQDELIGRHVNEILYSSLSDKEPPKWEESPIYNTCRGGQCYRETDATFWIPAGGEVLVEYTCTAIGGEHDAFTGGVIVFQDITERKATEEQLIKLAKYDQLTGLANRSLFRDFLTGSQSRAQRQGNFVALLFLDLDHFKDVNDTLGHDAGDLLLQNVAERVKSCVRGGDLVARLGGDEFAVVLDNVSDPRDAARTAQRILDVLEPPHILTSGEEVCVSSSIGITYSRGHEDPDAMCKAADTAMYNAKEKGRGNYQFFAPEMHRKVMERIRFENNLRHALERDEFAVHYQPQVDAADGRIVGMEALLRWNNPALGLLYPWQFMHRAEKTNLIFGICKWVLRQACATYREWAWDGCSTLPLTMAVNISGRQLKEQSLLETIENVLEETGLLPQLLEVELTEKAIMDDPEAAMTILDKIHGLGVRIALDDFGTGYSSLSCLRNLPVDTLKIDLSFMKDIGVDSNGEAIIRTIIALAGNLGLRVIAEGVETARQARFLLENGCPIMQGYYFSYPLIAEEADSLLKEGLKNYTP